MKEDKEVTRDSYNLNLLAMLMVLVRQILYNQAIAALAEAILMRISAEQLPSLHRVAPGCLKRVTSSYFWGFMLIFVLTLFALLVMIWPFSVLTFIPCALRFLSESVG